MQRSFIPIVMLISVWLLALSEQVPQPEAQIKSEVMSSDEEDAPSDSEPVKRSWNQLHSAWGKRSSDDEAEDIKDAIEELLSKNREQSKRNWNKLQGAWGKRAGGVVADYDRDIDDDDNDLYANSEGRQQLWGKLQGGWGKRLLSDAVPYFDGEQDRSPDGNAALKRSWNQLQGSWGKRNQILPARDHWSDKRGWTQLHGGWGKRSDWDDEGSSIGYPLSFPHNLAEKKRDWTNLRGSWGKRELLTANSAPDQGNQWSRKRESGWNNLKGLWG